MRYYWNIFVFVLALIAASTTTTQQAQADLLGYWPFEDDELGTTVADISGNANDGVAFGNFAFSPDGIIGSAGDFGAFDNGAYVSIDGDFDSIVDTQQATIAFWMNRQSEAAEDQWSFVFDGGSDSGDATSGRQLSSHAPWGDNNIYFDTGGCCGDSQRINTDMGVASTDGQWHHLAYVRDIDNSRIYIDGELHLASAEDAITSPVAPMIRATIGANADGLNSQAGLIDEFKIWNEALSVDEIGRMADDPGYIRRGESSIEYNCSFGLTEGNLVVQNATRDWDVSSRLCDPFDPFVCFLSVTGGDPNYTKSGPEHIGDDMVLGKPTPENQHNGTEQFPDKGEGDNRAHALAHTSGIDLNDSLHGTHGVRASVSAPEDRDGIASASHSYTFDVEWTGEVGYVTVGPQEIKAHSWSFGEADHSEPKEPPINCVGIAQQNVAGMTQNRSIFQVNASINGKGIDHSRTAAIDWNGGNIRADIDVNSSGYVEVILGDYVTPLLPMIGSVRVDFTDGVVTHAEKVGVFDGTVDDGETQKVKVVLPALESAFTTLDLTAVLETFEEDGARFHRIPVTPLDSFTQFTFTVGVDVQGGAIRAHDFNADGVLDIADFQILAANFNNSYDDFGEARGFGDINRDRKVDLRDFMEFRTVWSVSGAQAAQATGVPEPTAYHLLSGGVMLIVSLFRRRT